MKKSCLCFGICRGEISTGGLPLSSNFWIRQKAVLAVFWTALLPIKLHLRILLTESF